MLRPKIQSLPYEKAGSSLMSKYRNPANHICYNKPHHSYCFEDIDCDVSFMKRCLFFLNRCVRRSFYMFGRLYKILHFFAVFLTPSVITYDNGFVACPGYLSHCRMNNCTPKLIAHVATVVCFENAGCIVCTSILGRGKRS